MTEEVQIKIEKAKAKKTVPILRFNEFGGDWKESRLGSVAIVNPKTGNLPSKFIYIDLESVTKGRLVKEEMVTAEDSPSRAQRVLDKNDILYQTVRPYQRNNFFFSLEGNFVASTGYAQLRAKGDPAFLFQFLHTTPFVNLVNRWSTGTSYPAISPSELVKMKVNFPSLPEQKKIASFLSAVDKKIQQLTHKKELLETYKKGAMQQLFSQEIRFKNEDGKDFPHWEEKKLEDILVEYRLGGNYTNTEIETVYPLIKMGNLGRGNININKIEYIPVEEKIDSKDKLQFGDLLFNTRNTLQLVGKVSIWRNELPVAYYNSNLMFLKFENNFFMNYRLNSYEGVKALKRFATGTTSVAAIYNRDLLKVRLTIPSLNEQQKIADFLSAIDRKIEADSQQIEKTQSFKKGLLQQIFV